MALCSAPYTDLPSRRDGLKLARHFSAGIVETRFPSSPVGTADSTHAMSKPAIPSVVPAGTPNFCPRIFPPLKCRAKFNASLRDTKCVQGADRGTALQSASRTNPGLHAPACAQGAWRTVAEPEMIGLDLVSRVSR